MKSDIHLLSALLWLDQQRAKTDSRCKHCGQLLSMSEGQIWHTASNFVFCAIGGTKAEVDE